MFAGGKDLSGSLLKTTIFVTIDGYTSGPELPYSNADFCFLNNPQDSNFFMVGGLHDSKSLQIYNLKSNVWTAPDTPTHPNKSKIPNPVKDMACALNYYNGDLSIILIGGDWGSHPNFPGISASIQVYKLSTGFWTTPSKKS